MPAEELPNYGRLLQRVRQAAACRLSDEFHVFREKWLRFCAANQAPDEIRDAYVTAPEVMFLSEKPTGGACS